MELGKGKGRNTVIIKVNVTKPVRAPTQYAHYSLHQLPREWPIRVGYVYVNDVGPA
jgi:hypothetical protein